MIESTFQLGRGLGPRSERALWQAGVTCWTEFHGGTTRGLSRPAAHNLALAVDAAARALADGDADALAALLPAREHWRLFPAFADDAAYLDIETGDDVVGFAGISAIGILDARGPRLLLAGRDLESFPALASAWKVLVTFNGRSFDVPILRQAFPDWQPPACHIDLRHVLERVGHGGGLKSIERRLPMLHLRRPPHLDGIDGWDASRLFRRGCDGDHEAMRTFGEYNLYDAVNLRTLMAWSYNEMIDQVAAPFPAVRARACTLPIPERGDVLYDVSKLLLAIG